ncbi:unnamed protein product [Protopolystoma xenopodis]|uniref:Uncharacterized protein n=1 Tax=Protopolystoma xenopodis TaxID=117903 RepID=A0A448XJX2_9PLAT|nr:unnamed protein product [Protopolystoma xenopodis]
MGYCWEQVFASTSANAPFLALFVMPQSPRISQAIRVEGMQQAGARNACEAAQLGQVDSEGIIIPEEATPLAESWGRNKPIRGMGEEQVGPSREREEGKKRRLMRAKMDGCATGFGEEGRARKIQKSRRLDLAGFRRDRRATSEMSLGMGCTDPKATGVWVSVTLPRGADAPHSG